LSILLENIIDEDLAYNIESELIKRYGRKGYEKDGILSNICIDARPPNHRGKTYEEIYGVEKAQQQRELRSRLQKERGGYGPKRHSDETRKKFSKLNTGSGNPMYGKTQKQSTKDLIGAKAKLRVGKGNKNSYTYKLTSPQSVEHILCGSEAVEFCKKNNLSWSTLKMQIQKNWPIPKKENNGLEIRNNSKRIQSMIEIWGKPSCGYCDAARSLCESRHLNYSYYSLGNEFTREELLERFPEAKTYPQIIVNGSTIGGYKELSTYLEETGYNGTGWAL